MDSTGVLTNPATHHWLCEACGHQVPVRDPDLANRCEKARCDRCGHDFIGLKNKSLSMSLAFSLTALFLYLPANLLPFMSMELYGVKNSATIWQGVVQLADGGSWFIALVVVVASIVVPLLKLAVLFVLALRSHSERERLWKTRMYRWVEALGRWSMLDIYLLAVLVAIMKLGPWTNVEPGPGALLFAMVVIFTMLASATFHTRLIWRGHV